MKRSVTAVSGKALTIDNKAQGSWLRYGLGCNICGLNGLVLNLTGKEKNLDLCIDRLANQCIGQICTPPNSLAEVECVAHHH